MHSRCLHHDCTAVTTLLYSSAVRRREMGHYRLYCLNERGHFAKSHEIDAEDDQEALSRAKAMKMTVSCELWEQGRKVADLEPHSA